MATDWKDALSALSSSLPQGEDNPESQENVKSKDTDCQSQPLTVVTDKKGRNGKIATIIEGFTIPQEKVENLARDLKQKFGVGGSVRDGEILIQGDHKAKVVQFLKEQNFKTRTL